MKKLISFGCSVCLAVSVFASGEYGPNVPQTGVLNFPPGTVLNSSSNMFPFAFSVPPVMIFYATTTNSAPITNNFVTTTNFGVQSASTNNAIITWTAYLGYPRMQSGLTVIAATATPTNVAFAVPYAYPPSVTISPSVTNSGACVLAVTTTNFTMQGLVICTNSWTAFGQAFNPGLAPVTY
jgi:hypothetical protein